MVADVSDLNVDASCQVAHALSTHAVETEYDYFTAVDDHKAADAEEDAGAGMIGTVEFDSATLYRYATIDVDLLDMNLGDHQATIRAIQAFAQAFVKSMPSGKVNTFANNTLPEAIVITVRSDRPVSWVGAFEDPIRPQQDSGFTIRSAKRLVEYATDLQVVFDTPPEAAWISGVRSAAETLAPLGERCGFNDAVTALAELVEQRLS